MSVGYYLLCKKHREMVFVTDNKGNPFDAVEIRYFLRRHVYEHCNIEFVSEDHTGDAKLVVSDPDSYGNDCVNINDDGDIISD